MRGDAARQTHPRAGAPTRRAAPGPSLRTRAAAKAAHEAEQELLLVESAAEDGQAGGRRLEVTAIEDGPLDEEVDLGGDSDQAAEVEVHAGLGIEKPGASVGSLRGGVMVNGQVVVEAQPGAEVAARIAQGDAY